MRSLAATNRFGGKFISMTTSDGVCGHEVRLKTLFTHVSENITSLATSNNEHTHNRLNYFWIRIFIYFSYFYTIIFVLNYCFHKHVVKTQMVKSENGFQNEFQPTPTPAKNGRTARSNVPFAERNFLRDHFNDFCAAPSAWCTKFKDRTRFDFE